jgi:hypothetical protein
LFTIKLYNTFRTIIFRTIQDINTRIAPINIKAVFKNIKDITKEATKQIKLKQNPNAINTASIFIKNNKHLARPVINL